MPNDRARRPSSSGSTPGERRLRALVAFTTLIVVTLAWSTLGLAPSAGAAASGGGRIQNDSTWTFFSEAVFQGGCTVVTFATEPNQMTDDIGDNGTWNGGKKTVALHFLTGAEGHPYGLSPGVFHGKLEKGADTFSGSFRPTKPKGGANTATLVSGADPDC